MYNTSKTIEVLFMTNKKCDALKILLLQKSWTNQHNCFIALLSSALDAQPIKSFFAGITNQFPLTNKFTCNSWLTAPKREINQDAISECTRYDMVLHCYGIVVE